MKNEKKLVKLFIKLENDWHGYGTESVWAEPASNDKLIIKNTPFYAKGISFLDKVDFKVEDNNLFFDKVLERGGHSTYRILQPKKSNTEKFNEYWKPLQDLGCTYESKIDENALYAVDIPNDVDINKAYQLLTKGESDGVWSFEEGSYFKK